MTDNLQGHDPFMLLAVYQSYVAPQKTMAHAFMDPAHWDRMSILNTPRIGKFSSDRSIRDHDETIWNIRSGMVVDPDSKPLTGT